MGNRVVCWDRRREIVYDEAASRRSRTISLGGACQPAAPAGWPRRWLAEALAAQRKQALLFRRLATLRRDAPLAESLDDLAQRAPGLPAIVR